MKNLKIKYVLLFLLATTIGFAQPNPDALPGEQDQFDAPINKYVLVFACIVVLWSYKKLTHKIAKR